MKTITIFSFFLIFNVLGLFAQSDFRATDTLSTGTPRITLTWKAPALSGGQSLNYTITRDGIQLASISNPATTQLIDSNVQDGVVYQYCLRVRIFTGGIFLVSEHTNCDQGFTYSYANLFQASTDSSDAYIYLNWKIPLGCVQSAQPNRLYVELRDVTQNKVLYTERIDSITMQPYYTGSFRHALEPSVSRNYVINLFAIGPGTPVCQGFFSASGRTKAFTPPDVMGAADPHGAYIYWNPTSDLATKYKIYRRQGNQTILLATLDSTVYDLQDNFQKGNPNSIKNGETYRYYLEVYNLRLNRAFARDSIDLTIKPLNFSATDNVHSGKVELTWTLYPEYADGYRIFRDGNFLAQVNGEVSNYTDKRPVYGKRHFYTLQTVRRNNETVEVSDSGGVRAIGFASGRVTTLTGGFAVRGVRITARYSEGADSVVRQTMSDANGYFSFNELYFGPEGEITFTAERSGSGLQPAEIKKSFSAAKNHYSDIDFQDASMPKIGNGAAAINLRNLSSAAGLDILTLNWNYNRSDTTWFQIFRNDTLVEIINDGGAQRNSYNDISGRPGVNYSYKVVAYRRKSDSLLTHTAGANFNYPAVSPVQQARFSATPRVNEASVDISWGHSSVNFDGYRLVRDGVTIYEGPASDTVNFKDITGRNGDSVQYSISTMLLRGGQKFFSAPTIISKVQFPALTLPGVLSEISDSIRGRVTISWSYSRGISYNYDGFVVIRRKGSVNDTLAWIDKNFPYSYTDVTAEPVSAYTYSVRAFKRNQFSFSSARSISIGSYPAVPAPQNFTAQSGSHAGIIDLGWQNQPHDINIDGTIIRQGSDTFWLAAGILNYKWIAPTPITGASRNFSVQNYRTANGVRYYSAIRNASASPRSDSSGNLQTPANFKASRDVANHIVLQWDYPDYILPQFLVFKNGVQIASLPADARLFFDTSAEVGVEYAYQLRARFQNNTSPLVSSKGIRIKKREIYGNIMAEKTSKGIAGAMVKVWYDFQGSRFNFITKSDSNGFYKVSEVADIPAVSVYATAELQNFTLLPDTQQYSLSWTSGPVRMDFYDTFSTGYDMWEEISKPAFISASPDDYRQSVMVRWNVNGANFTGFKVLRGLAEVATILQGEERVFEDTAGVPGNMYLYRVKAFWDLPEGRLESEPIGTYAFYPFVAPPADFTLQQDANFDLLHLYWNHPSGNVDYYEIKRDDEKIGTVSAGQRSMFTDRNGVPGMGYLYSVAAVRKIGTRLYYSDSVTQAFVFPELSPVENLKASAPAGSNAINLSWNHVSQNFNGYRIYRDRQLLAVIDTTRTILFYNDFTAKPGVNHLYSVTVFARRQGTIYESRHAAATAILPAIRGLISLNAVTNDSNDRVQLNWAYTAGGLSGFEILRGANVIENITDTAKRSVLITPNTHSASETYTVRAYSMRDGIFRSSASNVSPAIPALARPRNLRASQGTSAAVVLQWDHWSEANTQFIIFENGVAIDTLNDPVRRSYTRVNPDVSKSGIPFQYTVRARRTGPGTWLSAASNTADGWFDNGLASNPGDSLSGNIGRGHGVFISGDWAAAGAYFENNNSSVLIYKRQSDGSWKFHQTVTPPTPDNSAQFGRSISIDGTTMVVGAPLYLVSGTRRGAAFVYELGTNGMWTRTQTLEGPTGSITTPYFGFSVHVKGSVLAIGSPYHTQVATNGGRVGVYKRNTSGIWAAYGSHSASGIALANEGNCVRVSGNLVFVGTPGEGNGSGAIWVFDVSTSFTLVDDITPLVRINGDQFGFSFDIRNEVLVASAPYNNSKGSGAGIAYVFEKVGTRYSEVKQLSPADLNASDYLGYEGISIEDGYVVIGALGKESPNNKGAAYVFEKRNNNWFEVQKFQPPANTITYFGYGVHLDKGIAIIGSIAEANRAGRVRFYNIASPPANVKASDDLKSKTKITWTKSTAPDIESYNIYRDSDLIATLSATQTLYDDPDGDPGKKYVYSVSTVLKNGGESSKASDEGASLPDGSLKGSVVTLSGGIGVPGVKVEARATIGGAVYRYETTTDAKGAFTIRDVYYEGITRYQVKVSMPFHAFVSDTASVDIEANQTQGIVPLFQDKTAFIICGTIARDASKCPLDSIKIEVKTHRNGAIETKEVVTDPSGFYSFLYDPLDIVLDSIVWRPVTERIKIVEGVADTQRYEFSPAKEGLYAFGQPVLKVERNFNEITKYPVNLRVANTCGRIPGSNTFFINIRSEDDCFNTTVSTNTAGEVVVNLPPLAYIMTVQEVSPLNQANLPILKYLTVRPQKVNVAEMVKAEMERGTPAQQIVLNQSFIYHKQPLIQLAGIRKYMCDDPQKPVVTQQGREEKFEIRVVENHNGSLCHVTEGFLKIRNNAATTKDTIVQFAAGLSRFPMYGFIGGAPNPIAPNVHFLYVEYHTVSGGYQGGISIPIIVEGIGVTPGNDIIVENANDGGQVQMPLMVLRDPPGDASMSYIEEGSSFSRTLTVEDENTGYAGYKIESKTLFGGVGFAIDFQGKAGGGTGRGAEYEVNVNITRRIETSSESMVHDKEYGGWMTGNKSDILVGAGLAMQYGLAQQVSVDHDKCEVTTQQILTANPNKISTTWIYTLDQINGLVQEYERRLTQLNQGTFSIAGMETPEAERYISTLLNNWRAMQRYHLVNTMPHYSLCDINRYNDLREPFKSQIEDWAKNGFCNKVWEYESDGKTIKGPKSNAFWNQKLIDDFNAVSQVVRNLENRDYQLKFPGGLTFGGSTGDVKIDAEYNAQYGADAENITFSGGATFSKEIAVSKSSSRSYKQKWFFSTENFVGLAFDGEVKTSTGVALGSFFSITIPAFKFEDKYGVIFGYDHTFDRAATLKLDTSRTVGYVLSDNDPGDQYSVTVIRGIDPAHTPYFQLVGGRTSCPSEPGAIARDVPILTLESPDQTSVLPYQFIADDAKPAVFPIKLSNNNPFGESRWYQLYVVENSNQYNAEISVGGTRLGTIDYFIPAGGSVYTNLEVKRSPNQYQHTDIFIALRPPCDQFYNLYQLDLSAEWKSPCSPVSILGTSADGLTISKDNWVISAADSGKRELLIIEVGDYDLNNSKLERIDLQYRRRGSNNWLTMTQLTRDSLQKYYKEFATNPPLPASYPYFWDITGNRNIPDGTYEIRALARCGVFGDIFSNAITGIIDREAIRLFGRPQPADGLLTLGEEISVSFNKDIDIGLLQKSFFKFIRKSDNTVVDFNYSANRNQINFTLNTPLNQLDGVILVASVDSVRDLAGNRLQAPVVWEFKVSNSPIYWNPSAVSHTTYRGRLDTIRVNLLNTDIGTYPVSLSNSGLSWVLPLASGGAVPPVGLPVNLILDTRGLNPGIYYDTILANVSGFKTERLPITIRVYPQPPTWHVNAAGFERSINVVANFRLNNGNASTDTLDRIAVSIGSEIRGVSNILRLGGNNYAAYITVFGNTDEISRNLPLDFRVWHAQSGVEYDAYLTSPLSFTGDNAIYGTVVNPLMLNVNTARDSARYIPLNEGWTWFSLNARNQNMSVKYLLRGLKAKQGDRLKTHNRSGEFTISGGWTSLQGLDSLHTDSGYLIRLSAADTLRYSGVNATINLLNLDTGWNLIGFPRQQADNINTAWVSTPEPANNDLIKSQTQAAQYNSGSKQWQGSLVNLIPTQAYMVRLGKALTVNFLKNSSDDPATWAVNPKAFEYNMVVTGMIAIDRIASVNPLDKVAAFINGQCRGIGQLQFVPNQNRYLLTMMIYHNAPAGDQVTFSIFDEGRNMVYKCIDFFNFKADSTVGSLILPFVFSNQYATALPVKMVLGKHLNAFPNPTRGVVNIVFTDNEPQSHTITLSDGRGRVVATHDFRTSESENELKLNLNDYGLSEGVYMIRVSNLRWSETIKVIKLREN